MYVHTGCQSQTKWQLGWVMVVLDLCNIFDKISGELVLNVNSPVNNFHIKMKKEPRL